MSARDTPAVLFVCLGNICRSPLAEGAFRQAAAQARLTVQIDSAGTGAWHTGEAPDPRAIRTAQRNGVDISGLRARQIRADDFFTFTHIFALDQDNLANIRHMAPQGHPAHVGLLLDVIDGRAGEAVADPYYGDESAFHVTWTDVTAAAQALAGLLSAPR